MPTIVLIKDGKTEHSLRLKDHTDVHLPSYTPLTFHFTDVHMYYRGFDELGGVDDFSTADMAYVLATHGVLNHEKTEDRSEDIGQR